MTKEIFFTIIEELSSYNFGFKDPDDISEWVHKDTHGQLFEDKYRVLSIDEFYHRKLGICIDMSNLIHEVMTKHNAMCKTYYIGLNNIEKSFHVFNIIKIDDIFYHPEMTYINNYGIHESTDVSSLIKHMLYKMSKRYNVCIFEVNMDIDYVDMIPEEYRNAIYGNSNNITNDVLQNKYSF